jgi:hypothetical protein
MIPSFRGAPLGADRVPDAVHRRAGTVTDAGACYGPGSAKHHAAKSGVLHRARDTRKTSGFRVRAKARAPE